jgi:Mn2+/Fe2+ NRAMP family transporter
MADCASAEDASLDGGGGTGADRLVQTLAPGVSQAGGGTLREGGVPESSFIWTRSRWEKSASSGTAFTAIGVVVLPGSACVGIVGTGLPAISVLAGSAAYAIAGVVNWRASLGHSLSQAPRFYTALSVTTILGLTVNFVPIDPMKALYWSAVINGVLATPLMSAMILLGSDRRVMGQFRLPWRLQVLGWACAVVSSVIGFLLSLRH